MTRNRAAPAGNPRAQQKRATCTTIATHLFCLEGGYVILAGAAASRGPEAFAAVGADWRDYHAIAITPAPEAAAESTLAELGRAAQSFDRVVICHSSGAGAAGSNEAAARFARAVRAAGRTVCHVVADAHRALRHCIDAMIPEDVICYCCDDTDAAARILEEYGAVPVKENATRTHAAPDGPTGDLTAARA